MSPALLNRFPLSHVAFTSQLASPTGNKPMTPTTQKVEQLEAQRELPRFGMAMPQLTVVRPVKSNRNLKGAETALTKAGQLFNNVQYANQKVLAPFKHKMRADNLALHQMSLSNDFVTPLVSSVMTPGLFFKDERMTAIGAYKVRGAMVAMKAGLDSGHTQFRLVSTGNHALAGLKAAELLSEASTDPLTVEVVVPTSITPDKLSKLVEAKQDLENRTSLTVSIRKEGQTFDEAKSWVDQQNDGVQYIDPFMDENVLAGQGTIGLEMFEQVRPQLLNMDDGAEVVVIGSVGGGGMLSSAATAFKQSVENDPELNDKNLKVRVIALSSWSDLAKAIHVKNRSTENLQRLQDLSANKGFDIPSNYLEPEPGLVMIQDPDLQKAFQHLKREEPLFNLSHKFEGPSVATLLPVIKGWVKPDPKKQLVLSILSGGNMGEEEMRCLANPS